MDSNTYENFPFRTVLISNALPVGIYITGIIVMAYLGWVFAIIFLAFILSLEFRVIRSHCINCYYWGKTCGFGKGQLSAWLFKKGNPAKFCIKAMTWKDMIPDMLISLIPWITGAVLLIIHFRLIILVALIILVFLTTIGNGYVRGSLTCKYCKQRDLGCPADNLFNQKPT
ncbi:MAG TPA: hypothetical protein VHO72_10190 [Bacteroidales bacterium]|nr:hypothetical protein [Bacteroidales bacterium]